MFHSPGPRPRSSAQALSLSPPYELLWPRHGIYAPGITPTRRGPRRHVPRGVLFCTAPKAAGRIKQVSRTLSYPAAPRAWIRHDLTLSGTSTVLVDALNPLA